MTPSSLMVHLTAGAANDDLLKLAAGFAERFKVTRVIGISACQPLPIYSEPNMYVPTQLIDEDRAEMDKELGEAEQRFRSALQGKTRTLEWRSTVTLNLLAEYIAEELRAADLLITAADTGGSVLDTTRRIATADLVMRAGRPILVVPPDADKLDLDKVMVAWKDSRESRRALQDALPILKVAKQVNVVEIVPQDDLENAKTRVADIVGWLEQHGISATPRAEASTGDDAVKLGIVAEVLGAGLLVGGAYGHNRLREWVLGGVTRDLLLRPLRPSLVSH